MQSVLISVNPKFCEKIASGECTILVRKTRPKLEMPFKCYIYCTNGDGSLNNTLLSNDRRFVLNQKVIGEFVCDRITGYCPYGLRGYELSKEALTAMCLSNEDLNKYGKLNKIYGWHISDLKIYDKPKELYDFYVAKPIPMEKQTEKDDCIHCKYHKWVGTMDEFIEKGIPMREECTLNKPEPICEYTPKITKPPQSWCYVEGEK